MMSIKMYFFKIINVLSLFILLTIPSVKAQIKFEKGFVIEKNGNKIECLIKNLDWHNSPNEIKYRLNKGEPVLIGNATNIKGFQIGGVKYVAAKVKYEKSTNNVQAMTSDVNFNYEDKSVFLKVLQEDKYNFYEYVSGYFARYFISTDGLDYQHLINKPFLHEGVYLKYIQRYKGQLKEILKCSNITDTALNDLEYKAEDLINFINNYKNCN